MKTCHQESPAEFTGQGAQQKASEVEDSAAPAPMNLFYEQRVEDARRQFNRIIAQWAQDVLVMRRAGRHRLRWHSAPLAA